MFTDERTLLNGAVAHQSVNMALASQTVPLVDGGLGPKLRLTKRTQASLGGGLRADRGQLDKIDNAYPPLTHSWQGQREREKRWMDAPKIIEQKLSKKTSFKWEHSEP